MMTLPPSERDRLAKLLGMLGSESEGERATAGKLADDLVRRNGSTWADVLTCAPAAPRLESIPHVEVARWVIHHGGDTLTGWERKFLFGVIRFKEITERQAVTLTELQRRVSDAQKAGGTNEPR